MIGLLNYGAGNVGSVLKAIEHLGHSAEVVDSPESLRAAEKIIFPGQGHFGTMMRALEERRLLKPLRDSLADGTPFLGICLGLQALYEASEEAPEVPGLALLPGRVTRFQGVFKVPHVGWSQLEIRSRGGLFRRGCRRQFRLLLPLLLRAGYQRKFGSDSVWADFRRRPRDEEHLGSTVSSGKVGRSGAEGFGKFPDLWAMKL